MLKGFAFFIVNATSNAAIKNHVRILHMARFSNSSRRFSRSGGKVQLAAIACAGFLGASVAERIFDNPLQNLGWPLFSTATQTNSPRDSSHSDVDIKRLMYRALMLRGMACSSPDLQSAPASQQDASLPLPCDEARKFANVIFRGSEISSDVQAALARDLQKFALAQSQAIALSIINKGDDGHDFCDTTTPAFPVTIAPSTIQGAGLGVFATRQITEGTIVTLYGGELKNKIEMFTAFGSDFAPAGPSIAFHSPLHTIDAGSSFVLDGKEFARADCPAFLCGTLVNHPPASTSPNTAFLNIRTPQSSPLLSLNPAPISFDPAALYYPAATEGGGESPDDVPVVALVAIRPVQAGEELFVDYNMMLPPQWCRCVTTEEIAKLCAPP